ncbi:MAG TPA: 16S rRNA processing protein RimM [Tenericutes bacterium]|nr:16S rRNA processing protein RimM [Mycoplasmatota bacterium]
MEYVYIGDIVNTHGIKGELKIISSFRYKDLVFKKGFSFYIGNRLDKVIVNTYRVHKNFDMVTFCDVNNINDAIVYKGDKVYVKRCDITEDVILDEDLIDIDVYDNDKFIGKVETIMKGIAQDIIVIKKNDTKHLIPYVEEFIKNIDLENNKMDINVIEGLLNEN